MFLNRLEKTKAELLIKKKYGIKAVLDSKKTLMAIATTIDCNDAQSMNLACLLLAALAVLEYSF